MYASKPDYHLGIVHAKHTTFLKLTTTMLHILTLQKKKRKQWMEQKRIQSHNNQHPQTSVKMKV